MRAGDPAPASLAFQHDRSAEGGLLAQGNASPTLGGAAPRARAVAPVSASALSSLPPSTSASTALRASAAIDAHESLHPRSPLIPSSTIPPGAQEYANTYPSLVYPDHDALMPDNNSLPRTRSIEYTAEDGVVSLPRRPLSSADVHTTSTHDVPSRGSSPLSPHIPLLGPRVRREDSRHSSCGSNTHAAHDQRTQLCVRNLPFNVRWQDVKDLFRRAGTVLRADVHVSPDNRSVGTGTVLFATEEDAHRAKDTLHGYSWFGRILDVQLEDEAHAWPEERTRIQAPLLRPQLSDPWGIHATSHTPYASLPYPGRVLFVGNLPFHCQWQDLKDLFRAAGNIQRADVALNADGRSRGFGTVLFASPEDAQTAVRLYHGYEYSGRVLKVHFDRHAHYGQPVMGVPSDPSQYTSAFQMGTHPMLHTGMLGGHAVDAALGWPVEAASDAPMPSVPAVTPPATSATAEPRPSPDAGNRFAPPHGGPPGRIALPPITFPNGAGLTPGIPMTPGMPGFMMRSMFETPPLYPPMMSPGISFGAPLSPGAPLVPNTMNSFVNAAPGAPVDFASAAYGSYMPSKLPPTPHWSQPMRPRMQASTSTEEPASQDPPVQTDEPTAPPPPTASSKTPSEYPFPIVDQAAGPSKSPTLENSTRELTDAIAKLSVRGTARSKHAQNNSANERVTAKEAFSRLQQSLSNEAEEVAAGSALTDAGVGTTS